MRDALEPVAIDEVAGSRRLAPFGAIQGSGRNPACGVCYPATFHPWANGRTRLARHDVLSQDNGTVRIDRLAVILMVGKKRELSTRLIGGVSINFS